MTSHIPNWPKVIILSDLSVSRLQDAVNAWLCLNFPTGITVHNISIAQGTRSVLNTELVWAASIFYTNP
jgi:hypothetical protein